METFIERLKGHWPRFLIQFPFEWWITLSFWNFANGKPGRSEYAKRRLKAWTRKLIKKYKVTPPTLYNWLKKNEITVKTEL